MLSFPGDVFISKSDILAERMGKYFPTVKVYERLSTDNNEGNKGKAMTAYLVMMSL